MHDFDSVNGAKPAGNLLQASDAKLYGLAAIGGNNGEGVLFQFDPVSGIFIKKHDFIGYEGALPNGTLVQMNGIFYGVCWSGEVTTAF